MVKKNVAIEIGNNKASIGFQQINEINIIQNLLGDEIEPSIVSLTNNIAISGENVYLSELSNSQNIITEIKRLIALNFLNDSQYFEEYKKYLSFQIEKTENNTLLINIKGITYSVEEILSFLIKQIIQNGKNKNIFANKKIVFTVPSCFGIQERELIKRAAKLADIDESKIEMINETSASAIAYELYINLDKFKFKYDYNIFKLDYNYLTDGNLTSGPALNSKLNKNILVFDLGAGCFNLSILNLIEITEDDKKKIKFKVKANLGNPFFGGIDFDNQLMKYCINEFCKLYKMKEEEIYANKNAIKLLKIRCEIAKKVLSKEENVIIHIKDFIANNDLIVNITRDIFDNICKYLYIEIGNKLNKILKMAKMNKENIKEVLLTGGMSKIPKIFGLLKDMFIQKTIIDYIDSDKIVITGAALYANELDKKNKNFYIHETVISSFGINIINNDMESFLNHGDKMLKFIKKNSYIPSNWEFNFKTKITNKNKINIDIYEGESNFVKFNKKIGNITFYDFEKSMVNKQIKLNMKFELDSYYILKVKVDIPECNQMKEITIGRLEKANLKKIKSELQEVGLDYDFIKIKNDLKDYSNKYLNFRDEERNKALINCSKCCEEILIRYKKKYINEHIIEKIYTITKNLFLYYLERLKIKNKQVNDNEQIIMDIKVGMERFIDTDGYNEILIKIFKEISNNNKNIYFSIILNYIELIIEKSINILKLDKQSTQLCFKIYSEKCEKVLENYSKEMKIYELNIELLKKIGILQKIIHYLKNFFSDSNDFSIIQNIKNEVSQLIKEDKYKQLRNILILIKNLENIKK